MCMYTVNRYILGIAVSPRPIMLSGSMNSVSSVVFDEVDEKEQRSVATAISTNDLNKTMILQVKSIGVL